MYGRVNVHEANYLFDIDDFTNVTNGEWRRLLEWGHLLTKTHSKGGAFLEGGAYWKEGAKWNHYGKCVTLIFFCF